MIYVEPSALLSILLEEDDAQTFQRRIMADAVRVISVVGKAEAAISLGRRLGDYALGQESIEQFCVDAEINILPAYPDLFVEIMKTYQRYGKGTGHPARLNFGDCFSYAVAKREGASLLFKGNDFSRTDIESAL